MSEEEKIKELVKLGYTNVQIAKEIGCHRGSVSKKMKRYDIIRPKNQKICVLCDKPLNNSRRNRCDSCNTKIRRYRAKEASVKYKGGKCEKCGFIGNLACFDFHHINPSNKLFNPNSTELANKSWEEVKLELDKCLLLCANCHRLEHNDYNNELLLEIANVQDKEIIFKS